jgi:hypothetical protein
VTSSCQTSRYRQRLRMLAVTLAALTSCSTVKQQGVPLVPGSSRYRHPNHTAAARDNSPGFWLGCSLWFWLTNDLLLVMQGADACRALGGSAEGAVAHSTQLQQELAALGALAALLPTTPE